jgi:type VI protein secretion system component VasK
VTGLPTLALGAALGVVAIAVLALLAVGIALGLKRLLKGDAPAETGGGQPKLTLSAAVSAAAAEVRDLARGRDNADAVPWILAVGAADQEMQSLLPAHAAAAAETRSIGWLDHARIAREGTLSFHRGGVVLTFDDGLVANSPWARKLGGLLSAVERARGERPIDALAVVVPAGLLSALADPQSPAALDAIAERGQRLYDIITKVQKHTGWRVPIHVLISGCDDAVPGFAEWLAAYQVEDGVTGRSETPVLGWAPPDGIDAAYRASWVETAFRSMARALTAQQFTLMMRPAQPGTETSIFLLPQRLEMLRAGVATLFERMLQASAYHEAFMFRGLYLTDGGNPAPQVAAGSVEADLTTGPAKTKPGAEAPGAASSGEPPAATADASAAADLSTLRLGPMAANAGGHDATAAGARPAPPRPIAHRVFDTRIFVEAGLAQPASGEMTRRHRGLRWAQAGFAATALAAILGVWGLQHFLDRHLEPIDRLLSTISTDVRHAETSSPQTIQAGQSVAGDCEAQRRDARETLMVATAEPAVLGQSEELLGLMARIRSNGVSTPWAPSSALDPLNDDVEEAVGIGYRITICRALLYKMGTREGINALLAPYALSIPADESWLNIVANAAKFDRHYNHLNQLREPGQSNREKVATFRDVAAFAFGIAVPATFNVDYQIYGRGVAESSAPRFEDAEVRRLFQNALDERFKAALQARYSCRPLARAVARIVDAFQVDASILGPDNPAGPGGVCADAMPPARQPRGVSGDSPAPEAVLRQFLADYQTISARGAIPGAYGWIYNPQVDDKGPAAQLPALEKLTLVSTAFIRELGRQSDTYRQDASQALSTATVSGTPVLAEVDGLPQPSPGMTATRAYVQQLLAQPFMAQSPALAGSDLPDGPIAWNLQRLQAAERAVESFLRFSFASPVDVPAPAQELARAAAIDHLSAYVDAELAAAAMPLGSVAEPDQAETAALALALPSLTRLRDLLRQSRAPSAAGLADQLDATVSRRAETLLRAAEQRLDRRAVYALDGNALQSWTGSDGLAPRAFGVATAEDLKAELAERQATVSAIVEAASPLANYLRDPGALMESADGAARAARLDRLRATLQAHEANRPGNALSRLEQFIAVDLDQMRLPSCRLRDPVGATRDYFSDQIRMIRQRALALCAGGMEARYAAMARRFNQDLAQQFPFAGPAAPAADPDRVRDFFLTYGDDLPALKEALAADGLRPYGAGGRAAADFVDDLIETQRALAPMFSAGRAGAPLAYRVDVEFFSDPGPGQSQVIEAAVGPPAARAVSSAPDPGFTWTNGQPISVLLRWAANAPSQPRSDRAGGGFTVDGATAQLRVDGDWALLRLIRRAEPRPAEIATTTRRGGLPIAFSVPLSPNLQKPAIGGDPRDLNEARVFLRLTLKSAAAAGPAGPPAKISLPPFPTMAPDLRRTAAQYPRQDQGGS